MIDHLYMPKKKSPTNQTTDSILLDFFHLGIYAFRNNTMGVYDREKGAYRPTNAKTGVSDILFIFPHYFSPQGKPVGQFGACEVKTGKDRLSKEQEGFLESVAKQNGITLTVKTHHDFRQQFLAYAQTLGKGKVFEIPCEKDCCKASSDGN